MKSYLVLLIGCLIGIVVNSCKQKKEVTSIEVTTEKKDKIVQLIDQLNNPTGSDIFVISHRAD